MVRKKFFRVFGLGFVGILFTRFSPMKVFFKKKKRDFTLQMNPLAVKRRKIDEKNV